MVTMSGKSGEQTYTMQERLMREMSMAKSVSEEYSIVCILAGTNDIGSYGSETCETVFSRLLIM